MVRCERGGGGYFFTFSFTGAMTFQNEFILVANVIETAAGTLAPG